MSHGSSAHATFPVIRLRVTNGGSVVNEAAFEYDSFLQLAADKQSHSGAVTESTPKVTYTYETGGVKNTIRRIITTYPTSSRKLEQHYDANSIDDHLSRLSALKVFGAPTRLVEYHYMGAAWQVRVVYPEPGVELTYKQLAGAPTGDAGDIYSGYDRFGRSIDLPWLKTSDSSVIERSQYGFDRDNRRTWQKRPQTSAQDQSYNYDALSQVTNAARGSLNLNQTAISGVPAFAEGWGYDPTGNWAELRQWGSNGQLSLDQDRVHDRGNRLTQIVGNAAPVLTDRAGRILQSAPDAAGDWGGRLELVWDAWSRIVQVVNNGGPVADYQYDGLHRRITRNAAGQPLIHTYYSDTWRPLEERRNAETTASASYLWGARHRDDLVRRDRAIAPSTNFNETRYVLMDYFNPAAITDETGAVKERYAFSAFGARSIMNPDWTARTTSESAFEFAFQGQFLDTESGLYNYGYRYYSPYLGRWTCKDPIGEDGGVNLFWLVSNAPSNYADFAGLRPDSQPSPFYPPPQKPKKKPCPPKGEPLPPVDPPPIIPLPPRRVPPLRLPPGGFPPIFPPRGGGKLPPGPGGDPFKGGGGSGGGGGGGGGIGGAIGAIWNAPNTAIGLLFGGIGMLGGANPTLGNNAIQFENHPLMLSGITLGNTIHYSSEMGPNTKSPESPMHSVGQHEQQHTLQGQILGPAYLPANILGGSISLMTSGSWHGNNFMEQGPMSDPPRPW